MSKLIDLTGRRFGMLTVIERAGTYISPGDLKKEPTWRCRCDCGKESIAYACNLRSGGTRSCGCLRKQNRRKKNATALL
jgi:hypothetical protein